MSVPSQYELDKALVTTAIEHALRSFEKDDFDKVIKKLNEEGAYLPDCFDHPELLQKVLKEIFGSSFTTIIIFSIQNWLGDSASNPSISNFLLEVLKENSTNNKTEQLTKPAILVAIEKSLLTMGVPELKKVESKLLSDFNCTLEDCVGNPIPLKKVLCELFGYCYEDIYQSINATLSNSSMNEDVKQFLTILKE